LCYHLSPESFENSSMFAASLPLTIIILQRRRIRGC